MGRWSDIFWVCVVLATVVCWFMRIVWVMVGVWLLLRLNCGLMLRFFDVWVAWSWFLGLDVRCFWFGVDSNLVDEWLFRMLFVALLWLNGCALWLCMRL